MTLDKDALDRYLTTNPIGNLPDEEIVEEAMAQPRRCRLPLTDQAKLEGEIPKLCYQDNCQGCTVWNLLQRQQVREAIAKLLCLNDSLDWDWLGEQQRYYGETDQQYYFRMVDQILSLTYPSGTPMLAVLDENQTKPQYTGDFLSNFDAERAQSNFTDVLYDFSIRVTTDLIKAGWRKTIP